MKIKKEKKKHSFIVFTWIWNIIEILLYKTTLSNKDTEILCKIMYIYLSILDAIICVSRDLEFIFVIFNAC